MPSPLNPAELHRRLSRRIDQGKSIQLSPEDLDLLVLSGAYDQLCAYANDYLKQQAQARMSERGAGVTRDGTTSD